MAVAAVSSSSPLSSLRHRPLVPRRPPCVIVASFPLVWWWWRHPRPPQSSLSSFHPRSTPQAVAREAGGEWWAVHRGAMSLPVLWWLVVVPGSSSSSCPLAIACTRLPPCEQLPAVAGAGAGLARPGCPGCRRCGRRCGRCPPLSRRRHLSPPFFVIVLIVPRCLVVLVLRP